MSRATISTVSMLLLALVLQPLAAGAQSSPKCVVPPELVASRPGPSETPTEIAAGLFLIDLRSIDDSKQSFDADVVVNLNWRDPRLDLEELAGCRVPLDAVWNPRALILNERLLRRSNDDLAIIEQGGSIRYRQRFTGEFTSPLYLRDFPADEHDVSIQIVAAYSPEEIAFRIDPELSGRLEDLSIAEWEVGRGQVTSEPLVVEAAAGSVSRSRLVFSLRVIREQGYYIWKIFVPLGLIVFMSSAVFWIDPRHLAPQIGIATSAILTLVAFQFSLGYLLPRLSYLTRADRFVMGSMLLVFLAFGEAVCTGFLADKGREALALKMDHAARWLFALGFLVVLATSFWL